LIYALQRYNKDSDSAQKRKEIFLFYTKKGLFFTFSSVFQRKIVFLQP